MEQRSARTTQHDPYERYGAASPGSGSDGGGAATRHSPRLPHPAPPAPAASAQAASAPAASAPAASAPGGRAQAQGSARTQAPASARPAADAGAGAAPRGAGARPAAGGPAAGRNRTVRGGSAQRAPRLTGLGVGVFASLLMVLMGGLVSLMPGGAPAFYGIGFLLVAMAAAVWVRPTELYAAPVALPLAYTIGLFFAGGTGDGFGGVLQNVFTGLALHAVWLYAGTLAAVLITLIRKASLSLEHRRNQRRAESGGREGGRQAG
ncbi:DUF6542 domain-containing protein [Streptomyces sp. 891-h]|uniref:DUF6542 domain-containing protein n=1 Tax=Streptomyces sp. 891-h TaxID=2720714 RepID=UPI001FA95492|nr:DUF6542 domain-containing protein [Streptomyces sp. 891-h]UNZ17529.1 hypothetical protein HC362_11140 [Streptomyces sp. 891-h]